MAAGSMVAADILVDITAAQDTEAATMEVLAEMS